MKYQHYVGIFVRQETPIYEEFDAPDDGTAVVIGASERTGLQMIKQGDKVVAFKVDNTWKPVDNVSFEGGPRPRNWETVLLMDLSTYKLTKDM